MYCEVGTVRSVYIIMKQSGAIQTGRLIMIVKVVN